MSSEFTGKKMAAILMAGFGVIVAVNLTMAAFAIGGFSGVVVENSYVASEKFNGWLEQERRQQELGWDARIERAGSRLIVRTENVPGHATVTAQLRRPLGDPQHTALSFSRGGAQRYVSEGALSAGRWIVRLRIDAGAHSWRKEQRLQ